MNYYKNISIIINNIDIINMTNMSNMIRNNSKSNTNTQINMIMAHDANYGIGNKGKLPWPTCKEDMRLFKNKTTGNANSNGISNGISKNAVVMGYDTWISIPKKYKPLSNRTNIVFSVNHYNELLEEKPDNTLVFNSWEKFKEHINDAICLYKEIWIIGGATIYRSAIDNLKINEIILTAFKQSYECDTFLNVKETLTNKGLTFDTKLINETNEYTMECLKVKQRVVS